MSDKQVEYLVVDTSAFIQNTTLHKFSSNIITCKEVIDEITDKRQIRRLVVLPYDIVVKDVFPENVKFITDFSKKTGDYPSLSATDIKVIALTYQLEKEKVGVNHLRSEPVSHKIKVNADRPIQEISSDVTGFYLPHREKNEMNTSEITEKKQKMSENTNEDDKLSSEFQSLSCHESEANSNESLRTEDVNSSEETLFSEDSDEDEDNTGWIKPSNLKQAQKLVNSQLTEEKHVLIACMTTDFAMQNVLKQLGLNVISIDGRIIKQLRNYILRCYTCFKTTSIMTKKFCPKCGNNTLKKVAVSVNENGEMQIHINPRKPLSGRGKRFSLPRIKGGKHPNNPVIVEDQPMPDNKPTRLARMKNNPLDDNYIAGFSPFIMRDINSKSAQLGIRPGSMCKQWMSKNPNESNRRRK